MSQLVHYGCTLEVMSLLDKFCFAGMHYFCTVKLHAPEEPLHDHLF